MSDEGHQLVGLGGFIVSGGFFLAAAVRAGDGLVILGCLAWIVACAIWARPVVRAWRQRRGDVPGWSDGHRPPSPGEGTP